MLGWMLKRGVGGGTSAPVTDGDTTLAEQPDTPAPVFAARAFKSALFGAPAVPSNPKPLPVTSTTNDIKDTPSKPPGILLTPGTGTTRRKRVSFGHDVGSSTTSQEAIQRGNEGAGRNRKRTRLTTAMENASRKNNAPRAKKGEADAKAGNDSDSEWEEEVEHDPHDYTVDLAEPHSESGKYWKEEFHKYRNDAKVEMDKMLKYKRLAKSYAKLKDAEAMELAELLRSEQQKVIAMEKKITESASTIVSQQKKPSSDKAVTDTIAKLTKQTALVVQYRQRVQELEDKLDDLVRKKDEESAPGQRLGSDSDRAVADLRDQVSRLQAQLKEAKAAPGGSSTDTARTRELRAQLRDAKEESRRKDVELRRLRREYEASQQTHEAQLQEMRDLLSQSQSRYAELKKEKAAGKADQGFQAIRPRSWHAPAEDTLDLAIGDPNVEPDLAGIAANPSRRQTLRDRFRKGAAVPEQVTADFDQAEALPTGRTTLEPPTQPLGVRRSPRNRAYGEEVVPSSSSDVRSARSRPRSIAAPDLPALAGIVSQSDRSPAKSQTDERVDLLKTQFAKLGGPEMAGNNSTVLGNTTTKGTLPPERRAAALARLERKRLERQKTKSKPGSDKENMRPVAA
ncbi:spindle pole body formation-associated protein [Sarocladium implicatum]|nr:spindle pole body formation-associated protein [Sarocladium implicatum]